MTTSARGRDGSDVARGGGGRVGDGSRGLDAAAALFAGPGEVRALARTLDWGATPLGWPDQWSPALRIATRAMLDAPHPICLWSGPELALVYNDAYRRILAAKHPAALGQPGAVVWAEIWAGLAPQFAQVWGGGAPVYGEDARFVMARLEGGATEDAWFSYSLSALNDEQGRIVAVLNISPETTARVRAEAELQASEERLRLAVAATGLGVFDWDLTTDRVTVNARFREIFGLPAGNAVIGAAMLGGVVHPDDRAFVEAQLAAAFDPRSSGAYQFEHRAVTLAGTVVWLLTFGQVLFAGDGDGRRAVRVIGNDLDITARKQTEAEREHAHQLLHDQAAELEATTQALQAQAAELEETNDALRAAAARLGESEGRLRRVADSGIVGLFFFDLDGGITEANDAFLALLGYTQADLAADRVDWRRMTPPEYAAADAAAVAQLVATGVHGQLAKEYLTQDGRRVPVVIQSALLHAGATRGVCVCLDDTARRHAEARLGRVLAQTPAAIAVLLGPDHVVQSANETFLRLLGRRDYVGRPARETAPELVEQGFLPLLDDVYRTGRPFAAREAPLVWDRDGDGTTHEGFFDVVYQPLTDATGATEGVLVFAVEVTAQVRARRAVEQLNVELHAQVRAAEEARAAADVERARAAEANAAKAQFLATMSHELRTPLNAIAGYAELLALGVRGPVTELQRQDLERLRRANQHMAGLVDAVLNFTHVTAGQVEYHLEAVRLGPLVADLEALVGPQLAAKALAYDHDACGPDTPDQPHVVRADPEKVRQILLNLLTNAAKFTDAGGRVALACETDAAAGVIRVRVTDTGRGIAADQIERIFEPFVQLDRQRTHASQQGVGLGLAISRDLARGMGGDLTVESTPGVGSTFTLTLPQG